MDTNGVFSPVPDPLVYYRQTFRRVCRMHGALAGTVIGFMKCLRASLSWEMDLPRIRHLEMADAISAVSPGALDLMVRHLRAYGRGDLAERIHLLPHPVSRQFHYDGRPKENQVVSVGRWTRRDRWQKDPSLLIKSLSVFLKKRTDYQALVIGPYDDLMGRELGRVPMDIRTRIILTGGIANEAITDLLRRSRISLCTSFHESFHIASAEALCSGMSVVAPRAPSLTSFPFFTANGCGELAKAATAGSLSEAMKREAVRWDSGERDPNHISGLWTSLVHAPKVATLVVEVLGMRS
jgi:glycosyltransferase involved in cell wall biosynthesis